jgi:hypothetical protein
MENIYTFKELYEKLRNEHNSTCIYRGQNKEFTGPLFPSIYRARQRSEKAYVFPKGFSSRKRGTQFYYSFGILHGNGCKTEEEFNNFCKYRETKRLLMSFVRDALGYCLSESLFQQAGWQSEGPDVTDNIDIASFFSLYHFNGKEYYPEDKNPDNIFLIYRWKIPKTNWTLEDLNAYSFYNRPPLVPTKSILTNFALCNSIEECRESIEEYRAAINWRFIGFDLDIIEGKRPFNIIKLPFMWLKKSRPINQDALLLLPDTISLEHFLSYYELNSLNEDEIEQMKHGLFVEDLASAFDCEKFYFRASPDDFQKYKQMVEVFYTTEDLSQELICGWMKTFNTPDRNEFTIPIPIPDTSNYMTTLYSKTDLKTLLENHEHRYNQ